MSGHPYLERHTDEAGEYRWHVKGGNGEPVAANTEGHPDPRTVEASIISTLVGILYDEELQVQVRETVAAWLGDTMGDHRDDGPVDVTVQGISTYRLADGEG